MRYEALKMDPFCQVWRYPRTSKSTSSTEHPVGLADLECVLQKERLLVISISCGKLMGLMVITSSVHVKDLFSKLEDILCLVLTLCS
jgi:hypothetical protein